MWTSFEMTGEMGTAASGCRHILPGTRRRKLHGGTFQFSEISSEKW
jgi:hypothetical protein